MENDSIYFWRKFENDTFIEYDENSESKIYSISDFNLFTIIENNFIKSFQEKYNQLKIPTRVDRLFNQLFSEYNVLDLQQQLIIFAGSFQKYYLDNYNVLPSEFEISLEKEGAEYEKLFDILESFLFNDDPNNIKSITFVYGRGASSHKFDNIILIRELYQSICDKYLINKGNFHQRKLEILSLTNKFKFTKVNEYVKTLVIQALFQFLETRIEKESEALRFIAKFLHICNIHINPKHVEDSFYEDLNLMVLPGEIKNLKHYVSRPKKFFK